VHPKAGEFGNLKQQKYSEILSGAARAGFKRQMRENRAAMAICGQCEMGPVGHEGHSFYNAMNVV